MHDMLRRNSLINNEQGLAAQIRAMQGHGTQRQGRIFIIAPALSSFWAQQYISTSPSSRDISLLSGFLWTLAAQGLCQQNVYTDLNYPRSSEDTHVKLIFPATTYQVGAGRLQRAIVALSTMKMGAPNLPKLFCFIQHFRAGRLL